MSARRRALGLMLSLGLSLLPAVLPSCALRVSHGTEVRVRATLDAPLPGVELEWVRLSLREITLVACPGEAEAHRLAWRSVARARHGSDDGRSLFESVLEMRAADLPPEPTSLGSLAPPPGRYCAVEVVIAPADAAPLEGRSVDAQLRRPATRLTAAGNRLIELPIEPLVLDAAAPAAVLTLQFRLAEALSELDLDASSEDLALDLLVVLPRHLRALVEPEPAA